MGGQACVLYGGAEFSRDIDFAVEAKASKARRAFGAMAVPTGLPRLQVPAFTLEVSGDCWMAGTLPNWSSALPGGAPGRRSHRSIIRPTMNSSMAVAPRRRTTG